MRAFGVPSASTVASEAASAMGSAAMASAIHWPKRAMGSEDSVKSPIVNAPGCLIAGSSFMAESNAARVRPGPESEPFLSWIGRAWCMAQPFRGAPAFARRGRMLVVDLAFLPPARKRRGEGRGQGRPQRHHRLAAAAAGESGGRRAHDDADRLDACQDGAARGA